METSQLESQGEGWNTQTILLETVKANPMIGRPSNNAAVNPKTKKMDEQKMSEWWGGCSLR